MELWGWIQHAFIISIAAARLFSRGFVPIYMLSRKIWVLFLHIFANSGYWWMFDLGQSDRWKWYVSASLNMQFSYCRWDWHLFKCLSHLNFFLPADCLLISLVHFFLLRFVGCGFLFFFFFKWFGRAPYLWSGEENGNPLQYSCLENTMDGGAWQATVHGITKSQTRLSNQLFTREN